MDTHKLLDGRAQAEALKAGIRTDVQRLAEQGWDIKLVSVEVGGTDATALYVRNQRRTCREVGIGFENRVYPATSTEAEVLAVIQTLNADPRVTGIILQRPVPPHLALDHLQNAVHPHKDVEGMTPANIGNIVYGNATLGPCTALASVEMLKSTGLDLHGLEVVIVGHSEIVGKPIALLLMEELATVTICHHGTRNLPLHTRRAEALFVAVGKPGLVTADMVKPGAAVIDIGINQVTEDGPDGPHTRVVGDVDFDSVHQVAGWITPVPGGVGPMTVAMLLRNAVTTMETQKAAYERAMRAVATALPATGPR